MIILKNISNCLKNYQVWSVFCWFLVLAASFSLVQILVEVTIKQYFSKYWADILLYVRNSLTFDLKQIALGVTNIPSIQRLSRYWVANTWSTSWQVQTNMHPLTQKGGYNIYCNWPFSSGELKRFDMHKHMICSRTCIYYTQDHIVSQEKHVQHFILTYI